MSLSPLQLLDLCDQTYRDAMFTAGPDGRDGASVYAFADAVVLCFRGTLTNGDFRSFLGWLNNFDARLVRDPRFPGRIHEGFRDFLDNILPSVLPTLHDAGLNVDNIPLPATKPEPWYRRWWNHFTGPQILAGDVSLVAPEPKKLLIIGHSLGGVEAVLAGVVFEHLNPEVITWAAPMPGDLDFAANYPANVKVTAYQSADDVVPWLPPWGYEMVGEIIAERDFAVFTDPHLRWKMRHRYAHGLMMDLLDPLKAKQAWERVMNAHHLETTYRPWLTKLKQTEAA